jgi:phosphohistidine phosphatase
MRVYLMQHGKPVSKAENPDRPLSEQGRGDVEKVTEFLGKSGVKLEVAFHSGKTRARQTAEIVVSQLNPDVKAQERAGLSPLDDVKEIARQIKDADKELLVAGDEAVSVVKFKQGGVVCLEKDEGGDWSVAWMVVPEIIKGSA